MTPYIPKGEFLNTGLRPIARIVSEVSHCTYIPVGSILGPSRKRHIVKARFMAMVICRDYVGATLPEIGRAFNRDHTCVINAMKRIDALCTDKDLDDMEEIARRAGLVKD